MDEQIEMVQSEEVIYITFAIRAWIEENYDRINAS